MKSRWPNPALVISIVALVVALGGTAVAATIITSSSQIKNGVITGADIRNSSIGNADLRRESIDGSRIREDTIAMNRLSTGTQRLLRGGEGGATESFEAFRKAGPENQPPGGLRRVASLQVPAGAYVITAKTIMTPALGDRNLFESLFSDNAGVGGECTLDAAGDADKGRAAIVVASRPTPATITMQITRAVAKNSTIALDCGSNIAWRTSDTTIIAMQVADATRGESTG